MLPLKNKKILIGVTGSIAVYKTCSLVNMFIQQGADVKVVMSEGATKFVTPLTFQTLTNKPVYTDMWNPVDQNSVEHISLAHWPDLILVAPATANTIAKISLGFSDNLLTTILLASLPDVKVLIAPAMNVNMWQNPIFQERMSVLKKNEKYSFVEPRSGILACRDEGKGKIAESDDIIKSALNLLK